MRTVLMFFLMMTDTEAWLKSQSIWGTGAQNQVSFVSGHHVYKVGCRVKGEFRVAGKGDSWELAFADVDMETNGPLWFNVIVEDIWGNKAAYRPIQVMRCTPKK